MLRPFHNEGSIPSMLRVSEAMNCRTALPLAALLLISSGALAADPVEDKAKICAACHGEQGIPQLKTTPVIWGQNQGYLIYQLRDFKSGARKNDLMAPIVATLEQDDITALAAYFSKLKWPNLQQPAAPADVATKAQAAAASIGCPGCHLAYFQGDGTTARLAGQQHDYLAKTMGDFRDKTRGNNPGMSDLMKATSPEDLAALAQYLSGLQIDQYLNQGQ
jgi:cytochrome c553